MNICFTGHRPKKLGGYDWGAPKNKKIMSTLLNNIILIMNNTDSLDFTFICGGALGIDQMAFEICADLRDVATIHDIKLVLAMPFEKQDGNWFSQKDKDRLKSQRERADEVVLVDTLPDYSYPVVPVGGYHPYKMELRNRYMVNHSDLVIAVWNGSKGGTKNCVDYAKRVGKRVIIINPEEL
jgi:uncharacterized phage-like protein YoqJ